MLHRVHDYRHLIERWKAVARRSGVRLRRLVEMDGYSHFCFPTPGLATTPGIYLSAGIHGDEPASCEALIAWAEKHARTLARIPLLVLPCLNPWGLVRNVRTDARGEDLNRAFHRDDHPLIHAVKQAAAHRFHAALMLHEDYDGQGIYLYEVQRVQPYWGEELLATARPHLPIDPRLRIDGRKAVKGIHRRKINRQRMARIGYPEAIWLQEEHTKRAFTIETPSEFALERRVAAHVAIIEEVVRRVLDRRA